jgi:predicted ATPase
MHLVRFTATGIHGYLKFNIKFGKKLTFITGINGSGKTSAINAIISLITPDLSTLSDLEFERIKVDLEHDGKLLSVTAVDQDKLFTLSVSGSDEFLTVIKYVPDEDLAHHRQIDAQTEHYREFMTNNASHPVLALIASLPTPMFLGLDRRARFDEASLRRPRFGIQRPRRGGRNIFGGSLARSLDDAAELAETRYRDALIESGRIAERLQKELLLGLLMVDENDNELTGGISVPSHDDLKEIAAVKRDLDALPQIFRLPSKEVKSRVLPFLNSLLETAAKIPAGSDLSKLSYSNEKDRDVTNAIFSWSANQSHLKRFKTISRIVAKYNEERTQALSTTTKYLALIKGFLKDSGKSVLFDDRGYLHVAIDGIEDPKSILSLSSGEAQIFVILTHLSFNPSAQKNVFIIDEPELSLHVQWQEIFVDSLVSANPNIQYIMATHSPSIILERTADCIDISRKLNKQAKA